jgi:UTP--glucose-1-phosphate uridylyltransferase
LAVMRVGRNEIGQYGVIRSRPLSANVYEVLDLIEKPTTSVAPSDMAIVGRYVLTPDIFPILIETPPDAGGEIQLTNALAALRRRRPIFALEFCGKRYDTGDKLGFLKATVEFALARPDLGEPFRQYLRSLNLGNPRPVLKPDDEVVRVPHVGLEGIHRPGPGDSVPSAQRRA